MKKTQGAISILVLFIFLILSFLVLFLVLSLEQRSLTYSNDYDGLQSSYISESLALATYENLSYEQDIYGQVLREGSFPIEGVSFNGFQPQKASIYKFREETQDLSKFCIDISSEYKNISSRAQLMGNLINPIFNQVEDGILDGEDLKNNGLDRSFFDALYGDFYKSNRNFSGDKILISQPMVAQMKGSNIEFFPSIVDGGLDPLNQTGPQAFSVPRPLNIILYEILEVEGDLSVRGPANMRGLVIVKNGAKLRIEDSFSLEGVFLVEEGGVIEGQIGVNGLLINLTQGPIPGRKIFSPTLLENCLVGFEGLIKPEFLYIKKVF